MAEFVNGNVNTLCRSFFRLKFHQRVILKLLPAGGFFDQIGNIKKIEADFVIVGQSGRVKIIKLLERLGDFRQAKQRISLLGKITAGSKCVALPPSVKARREMPNDALERA